MKITGVEVRHVEAESTAVHFSHMSIPTRSMYLLRVFTDAGHEGLGEIDAAATGLPGTIQMLEERFLPALLGEDPRMIGKIWEKLFGLVRPMGRFQSNEMYVLGAVDIALWDILGKITSQPIARLLGQVRKSVPAYASLGYVSPDDIAAVVRDQRDKGFRAVKIRIGFDEEEDLELVRTATEAAGPAMGVMVDVNSGWQPMSGLRSARQLEAYKLVWIEEPLEPYYLSSTAEMAAALDTPIAIGEHEIFNLYDAARVIACKAADVLQPDLRAGGLSECRRIAAYAAAHGVPCIPHFYGNGVRYAALVHFASATSNCPWVETDVHANPLRSQLFSSSLEPRAGEVEVEEKPGLGVTLNMDLLDQFTVFKTAVGDHVAAIA